MLTYNQIIKVSRNFQQAHHVLKNFGNGFNWDEVLHNQQTAFRYPLMWIEDLPSSQSEGLETFSFRVAFMAQVVTLKERGTDLMSTNANEVRSDMIQCSNDFIAYWINQTDNYPLLTIDKSVNRTTFEDLTDDKLTGCYIDVSFRQPFDYNECSIPMGTPTSVTTCLPVYIYEDGILVDTVASGGSYSYTSGGGSTPVDVTVNGTLVYDQVTTDQALRVVDSGDNEIGSLDGANTWLIENSVVHIKDTDNNTLYDVSVAPTGSATQVIDDVTVDNSNVTFTVDITAEGTYELPDTTVEVFLDGVSQGTGTIVTLDPNAVVNINWV